MVMFGMGRVTAERRGEKMAADRFRGGSPKGKNLRIGRGGGTEWGKNEKGFSDEEHNKQEDKHKPKKKKKMDLKKEEETLKSRSQGWTAAWPSHWGTQKHFKKGVGQQRNLEGERKERRAPRGHLFQMAGTLGKKEGRKPKNNAGSIDGKGNWKGEKDRSRRSVVGGKHGGKLKKEVHGIKNVGDQ